MTPASPRRVCQLTRWQAASLYLREVDALRSELSMTTPATSCARASGDAASRTARCCATCATRLPATLRADRGVARRARRRARCAVIERAEELTEPLALCHRSLVETGDSAAGARAGCATCCGASPRSALTLVRLDLRQHAARHAEALDAITRELGLGAYDEWSEAERQAFLLRELQGRRPLIPADLAARPTCARCSTRSARPRGSPANRWAPTSSRWRRPSDVLAVELLQKEVGTDRPLRVVPLFETSTTCATRAASCASCSPLPWYRARDATGGRRS